MKLYPLVAKLENKICSFIGGGNLISKKIQDLLNYNIKAFLFAKEVCEELENFVKNNSNQIIWKKNVNYEILLKSYLIFISDETIQKEEKKIHPNSLSEIQSIIKFSEKYSKFVCFIDVPQYCSFYNTHIYEKGPILISISTSGTAPVIGNFIKQKLDSIVTDDLILLTEFLAKFRTKITSQIRNPEKRKELYQRLLSTDFISTLKRNEEEGISILFKYIVEAYTETKE
ncbi:MAG: bifunctional precorrin-2 dehydrogenase/sirohydrochlorin ferrochelatase [Leptonema sp. (in: bacteria)]